MITKLKYYADERRRRHKQEMRFLKSENIMLRKLIEHYEPNSYILTHTYPARGLSGTQATVAPSAAVACATC